DEGASLEMFYFHSDHLGSSNFITNIVGEISQHMEYTAFGEMFVEEHKNSNNSPYKFNAKELDEETGNYYYGARYYNPKWSVWLSVDPLAEKYPGWSPYNYTLNNPVRFTDPTGMVVEESQGPTDHWKLNDSGKLELIKKTDDDFNVFFDENGNKLFQTNEQSEELKSEEWEGKSDEYINKMKTVFIEIANEEEVYNTMEQRAEETGFDESIITLEQMKSVGNEYQDIGPILGVLDGIKEAPKWGVNPGSAAKSILQQAGKSIYKGSTGTDITKDVKNYANRAWQGIKDFATDFSNGTFMDYFILK
ncbi:RHS repeat domain-containing protein, partial [Mesonia oceanica]